MVFQTVIGGYRSLELVSWANGTPEQIAAMLDAHYAGRINIANYWSIGDTRNVTLGAIPANDSTGAMAAQAVQLVLMNFGGKTLVNAEHGTTDCACVVGFKNCLTGVGKIDTEANGKYSSSDIRSLLNNELFVALPSDLQGLFKIFVNQSTNYTGTSAKSLVTTEDLLVLPAAVEVTGTVPSGALAGEGSLFSYYNTSSNRIKRINSSASPYWLRTNISNQVTTNCFAYITTSGTIYSSGSRADNTSGISPYGVI